MSGQYDRTRDDVGNIVALEHVNVTVPDQRLATIFYIMGMGFTRDPYMQIGDENMWANVGRQQFHLPTRAPQVLRGHVGVVVPDLGALQKRLAGVRQKLAETRFAFEDRGDHVAATSPWGNRLQCYAPGPRFGDMVLGLPYVEFTVRRGVVEGIARFYREVFAAPAALIDGGADPNLYDSLWTRPAWSPLMNAVHKSQGRMVQLLIERGADVNARTSDGTTPLALSEDRKITELLVAAGAARRS